MIQRHTEKKSVYIRPLRVRLWPLITDYPTMKRFTAFCIGLLAAGSLSAQTFVPDTLLYTYHLHGQTRKYECHFQPSDDGLRLNWRILRNGAWQTGSYTMTATALQTGTALSLLQPEDRRHLTLPAHETFGILSASALQTLKSQQPCTYSGVTYRLQDTAERALGMPLLHAVDEREGGELWVLDCPACPVIWKMRNNPLEINWTVSPYSERTRQATAGNDLKSQLLQCPEKLGSIYYAYPTPSGKRTPEPKGYHPVYISHYGRHGSRYLTDDNRYTPSVQLFDSLSACKELTALGEDVHRRLQQVWADAEGHGGQLSAIGDRQHREIARRMFQSFPSVFEGETPVTAVVSTSQRCIMSMAAFCESLKEQNPRLQVTRWTGDRYMRYIHYSTPEVKFMESPQAPWYGDYLAFCREKIRPERFLARLFLHPERISRPDEVMMGLYWIAVDMQDTTPERTFFDLFTPEELFGIWQTVNYRMYICNACAPVGQQAGPRSAHSLLDDIVQKADAALQADAPSVDLRFGHDTNLIRLLALMQVEGCAHRETDPDRYYLAWQDYRISPMAANLQLIFYRNGKGKVLVKLLHNEEEAYLPLPDSTAPYYDWEAVKRLFTQE